MMKDTQILSANQEFFTISTTGESAISIRGLSRMSGIPKSTLIDWFKHDLTGNGTPETLKALSCKALYLTEDVKIRGKLVKPIRESIASQVIKYAAFTLHRTEAQDSISEFIDIGLASYIQGITGFLSEQNQRSTKDARHEITRLVKEPNPWKRLYSAETCEKIRSWYFPRDFFWKFCYAWMTSDEIQFLNEHNPVIPGIWQRRSRIFQNLSQATRDRLAPEIAALCTLIESSTGKDDFETRWQRIHGADQQELFNA